MSKPQYGPEHQARRRRWNDRLTARGPITCRRCGQPVHCDRDRHLNPDGRPFDLGHGRAHADGGDGRDSQPEHARCNRHAGAKDGRRRQLQPSSQEWW